MRHHVFSPDGKREELTKSVDSAMKIVVEAVGHEPTGALAGQPRPDRPPPLIAGDVSSAADDLLVVDADLGRYLFPRRAGSALPISSSP